MIGSFKDVTIDGVEYRIGSFTPKTGARVLFQLGQLKTGNEAVYDSILDSCLDVVSILEKKGEEKFALKMYSKSENRWLKPEITSPIVLNSLLMEVNNFNFEVFMQPLEKQENTFSIPATQ